MIQCEDRLEEVEKEALKVMRHVQNSMTLGSVHQHSHDLELITNYCKLSETTDAFH